jgi:lysophospholipase L1-like esterase
MSDQKVKKPRRLRAIALKLLIVILAMEVLLRVGTYFALHRNPYYLFYGFQGAVSQVNVSPWSVYEGQYFKYPPSYELHGAAGQAGERARTNSLGFRGPDFTPEKAAGTFRVFCMGGSSTFGFHNSDDETYPHYLQQLLAREPATAHFEVVNAGFPYYNTATIRGLLTEELVEYEPDLVTLYAGYNDTCWPLDVGLWFRAVNWVQENSITCFVIKQTILTDKRIYGLRGKFRRRFGRGGDSADADELQADVERIAARYRANLEAIVSLAKERGFQLVLIRQPMTAVTANESLRGLTYEQEYQGVLEKLARGELLADVDRSMIAHHRLLEELDALAAREGLPVVDNVALLDRDRSRLASWVHLEPEANHELAEALVPVVQSFAVQ